MPPPDKLDPAEREPFQQLKKRFGDRFQFRIKNKHVVFIDLSWCELTTVKA